MECFAEFLAVFLYVWMGVGATASFIITNVGAQPGVGTLFQIGFAYGIGIVAALSVCAATSGGHFSPCVTIVQAIFRGFPWRKVPGYILSQILGAYIACLCIYLAYKDTLLELEELLIVTGKFDTLFFTPQGPGGIFALYANPGKPLGFIFWNEFVIDVVLGLVIWATLDPTNFFTPPAAAPWIVGMAYAAAIWGFAPANMAANTARDVGARLMVLTIWGKQAAGGPYAAIAALTNIPAMIIAVLIYEFMLTDSSRVLPQAQRDFLIGHKAHLDHKNSAAPEDYVNRGTVGAMQGGGHNGSTSSDQEKAHVTMRE